MSGTVENSNEMCAEIAPVKKEIFTPDDVRKAYMDQFKVQFGYRF